jgi:hypothetical protein
MGAKTVGSMYGHLVERELFGASLLPQITSDGTAVDGVAFSQIEICRTCPDRRCAGASSLQVGDIEADLCYRGVGFVRMGSRTGPHTFNGVFTDEVYRTLPRREKKRYENRRVSARVIAKWASSVSSLSDDVDRMIAEKIDDALGMMHDVQTAVSSLLRSAEDYVDEQPGATFDDKFEKLSPAAKQIMKSAQLVQSRLALLPLLSNPDAAKYGQKHATPVYRLVHKLVRVMRSIADKRGILIHLVGASFNQPPAYDSFETIPLVLLDNAVKYSQPNQDIEVTVNDVPGGVRVAIRSFSPEIPKEFRSRIFDKGERGPWAQRVASKGSGLGLFLASTVASAHYMNITHYSEGSIVTVGDVPYCLNTFEFTLR